MESSESVFRDPKFYLSNDSSLDVTAVEQYSLPNGFPARDPFNNHGLQAKYVFSNASTATVASVYPNKEFKMEQKKAPVKPVVEQAFPEGGLAGWATALGA